MWLFAGAALGALVTWMTMHVLGRNAYQQGFDHGRTEAEGDWQERFQAGERERERLIAALAQATEQAAGTPLLAAPSPATPSPHVQREP
jgi:hypothetical protein